MILNGVCVLWLGWIDLIRLEGMGSLQYDEELAYQEDLILKKQIKCYSNTSENEHIHEL